MLRAFLAILLILLANPALSSALEKPEKDLALITPQDRVGQPVDLELQFRDTSGQLVKIKDFFIPGRPVVMVPGYFTCPHLCGLVFTGVAELVNRLELKLGKDYQIVTVSFDHTDSPEQALEKEQEYVARLTDKTTPKESWKFLVGEKEPISKLMGQLGFKYLNDGKDYAHSAAVYVLTPEGVISQHFADIKFNPFDLKLALVEASKGNIGNFIDQALLFCFRFDHTKGKYAWVVQDSLRVGGVLVILLLGGLLVKLWVFEKRKA